MDFLNQNLIYLKTYKNFFIKGNFKKFFTFDLLNFSISKPSHKRTKDLKMLGEKRMGQFSITKFNPKNPAVKLIAAKITNSIESLGAEFIKN